MHNKQSFDVSSSLYDLNIIESIGRTYDAYLLPKQVKKDLPLAFDRVDNWVSCDQCGKYRRVPEKVYTKNFFCRDNPDPNMRSCDIPEEEHDEENAPSIHYEVTGGIDIERVPTPDDVSIKEEDPTAYQLGNKIGHGAHSEVWRGTWSNSEVAIKVNNKSWSANYSSCYLQIVKHNWKYLNRTLNEKSITCKL
jgi:hypothetical protein